MTGENNEFTPYGKQWEQEVIKLPKETLVEMIRKANTGTGDKKLCAIETLEQAENQIEGIINDFETGLIDKPECMRLLGEYTGRLMDLFWKNAKKLILEDNG